MYVDSPTQRPAVWLLRWQNNESWVAVIRDLLYCTLTRVIDDDCAVWMTCQTHSYCIQAVVLRNSWPLSQSQWSFVQSLKDNEQSEQNERNEAKGSTSIIWTLLSQLLIQLWLCIIVIYASLIHDKIISTLAGSHLTVLQTIGLTD